MATHQNHGLGSSRSDLIWGDGFAGAVVGVLMLVLASPLSVWYQVPRDFLIFMGIVNLAYAAYSLSLARRPRRPMAMILFLICANGIWGALCLWWAFDFRETAGWLGIGHFIIEGLFVGGLAVWEWCWRESLVDARPQIQA